MINYLNKKYRVIYSDTKINSIAKISLEIYWEIKNESKIFIRYRITKTEYSVDSLISYL